MASYNNRLSQTLANNIKLDSIIEHNAEKLCGGNMIWLVSRPAGVQIYINSIPDRTSALILNEANRGYKWEDLGQYGDLKLYDNFYIWTEGTNINNDKIEIQISPNADIITPILGNTADKIDKIDTIENFSQNALIQLSNAIYNYNTFIQDASTIRILDTGKFSFRTNEANKQFRYCHFISDNGLVSDFNLIDNQYYKIEIFGHIDIGSIGEYSESGGDTQGDCILSSNCHLSFFSNENNATFRPLTDLEQSEILRAFELDKETDGALTKFDIIGQKYFYESVGTTNYENNDRFIYFNGQNQININKILLGSDLNRFKYFGLFFNFLKLWNNYATATMHFSLIVTISKAYSNETL